MNLPFTINQIHFILVKMLVENPDYSFLVNLVNPKEISLKIRWKVIK